MMGLRLAGCCSLQDGQDEVNTRPLPPRHPSVLLASVLLHFGCQMAEGKIPLLRNLFVFTVVRRRAFLKRFIRS